MMEKLKPCPFCGGEATVRTATTKTYPNHVQAWCYCKKCSSSNKPFTDYDDDGTCVFKAIEAWNRRVE